MIPEETLLAVSDFPLTALQLAPRTVRGLRDSGITTLGELWALQARDPDFRGVEGLGRRGIEDIQSRLHRVLTRAATTRAEELDDLRDPRPFLAEINHGSVPPLVVLLPSLAKALSVAHNSPREYEILRRRYGFEGSSVYTLDEIGSFYGLTRERVRQLEERAKRRLATALESNDEDAPYRVAHQARSEFGDIRTFINNGPSLIRETDVVRQLATRCTNVPAEVLRSGVPLLMELLGGRSSRPAAVGLREGSGTVWSFSPSVDFKRTAAIVQHLRNHLEQVIRPESLFHLTVLLNRSLKNRVTAEEVRQNIGLIEEIEEVRPDEFQCRFECLRNIGDRAYAVLVDEGTPLHFRQIARKINQRLVAAGLQPSLTLHQSLGSQLSMDQRFEAVARSGAWKLAEWPHIRTESIVELMQEALLVRQEPSTYAEIHDFVCQHRPDVPKASLASLAALRTDLFLRRFDGKIELVAWGNPEGAKLSSRTTSQVVRQQMKEVVLSFFKKSEAEVVSLSSLVRQIQSETELAETTVRARLARSRWLEIFGPQARRSVRLITSALDEDSDTKPVGRIRNEIERLVTEYLRAQPEGRASFLDVWNHIQQLRSRIKRPSLYAALSKMSLLTKQHRDNRVYYILKAFQHEKPIELPELSAVVDARLRSDLETAQGNLTVRNIDAGLFQLGKIFEGELKRLLTKAQSSAAFPVNSKDLYSLSNMIDCVVKNKIIRHEHHLTLLREHRNARAHGSIPTESERKELMSHAPLLVHYYMMYIKLINEAERKLGQA